MQAIGQVFVGVAYFPLIFSIFVYMMLYFQMEFRIDFSMVLIP